MFSPRLHLAIRPAIVQLCGVGAFIPISFLWSLPQGFSALNVKLNKIPRGLPPKLTQQQIRRTLLNLIGILLPANCLNSSKIHLVLICVLCISWRPEDSKLLLPSKSSPSWENWDVTPGREAGFGETCGRSHRAVAAPLAPQEQHRPRALTPLDAPRQLTVSSCGAGPGAAPAGPPRRDPGTYRARAARGAGR